MNFGTVFGQFHKRSSRRKVLDGFAAVKLKSSKTM